VRIRVICGFLQIWNRMKRSDKLLPAVPLMMGLILVLLAMFGRSANSEVLIVGGVVCASIAVLCRLVVILVEQITHSQ